MDDNAGATSAVPLLVPLNPKSSVTTASTGPFREITWISEPSEPRVLGTADSRWKLWDTAAASPMEETPGKGDKGPRQDAFTKFSTPKMEGQMSIGEESPVSEEEKGTAESPCREDAKELGRKGKGEGERLTVVMSPRDDRVSVRLVDSGKAVEIGGHEAGSEVVLVRPNLAVSPAKPSQPSATKAPRPAQHTHTRESGQLAAIVLRARGSKEHLPPTLIPPEFHKTSATPLAPEGKSSGATYDGSTNCWVHKRFPSDHPTSRTEVLELAMATDAMLARVDRGEAHDMQAAALKNEQSVWSVALNEVARQVGAHCAERGALLSRIREAIDGLFDSLVGLLGKLHDKDRKAQQTIQHATCEIKKLEEEREEMLDELERKELKLRTVRLEQQKVTLAQIREREIAALLAPPSETTHLRDRERYIRSGVNSKTWKGEKLWEEHVVPFELLPVNHEVVNWVSSSHEREAQTSQAACDTLEQAQQVRDFTTPPAEMIAMRASAIRDRTRRGEAMPPPRPLPLPNIKDIRRGRIDPGPPCLDKPPARPTPRARGTLPAVTPSQPYPRPTKRKQ